MDLGFRVPLSLVFFHSVLTSSKSAANPKPLGTRSPQPYIRLSNHLSIYPFIDSSMYLHSYMRICGSVLLSFSPSLLLSFSPSPSLSLPLSLSLSLALSLSLSLSFSMYTYIYIYGATRVEYIYMQIQIYSY